MKDEDAFSIVHLKSVGLERWFEVGEKPKDLPAAVAKLRKLMTPDPARTPFRLVALDGKNRVRSKLGGYITVNGRFTFWDVYHREGEKPSTRRTLPRSLIEACMELARNTPGVDFLETKPAYDSPDRSIFVSSLRALGFREIGRSHVYTRNLVHVPPPMPPPLGGLERLNANEFQLDVLGRLLEASQAKTLDRVQQDDSLFRRYPLDELRSSDRSLWSVAAIRGRPVGLIICGGTGQSDSPPGEVVILELAVLPEFRQRKIGAWLVGEMLSILKDLEATQVYAMIDDENIASRRLHINAGFKRNPGSFWTWRYHMAASRRRSPDSPEE
jgi:ribosomal protein S18 acetylase RimI-like enzyme